MSLVFNIGKRSFLDVAKDSKGEPLDLNPGENMEFSEKKAKALVKSYPKELSLVEGDSQRQKKRANEIKQREAELDEIEKKLKSGAKEIGDKLEKKEAELDKKEKSFDDKKAELDKREAALNTREENLKKSENGDEKEPKEKNGDKK